MRVVVLYHPRSEHAGKVEDYARDYKLRAKTKELELVSLETVQGADLAKLYGIISYPAVLAISADGQLQKLWQGSNLPLMNELDYYTKS